MADLNLNNLETDITNMELQRESIQKEIADLQNELKMEQATVDRLNNAHKEYKELLQQQERKKSLADLSKQKEEARMTINNLVDILGKGMK